MFFDKNLLFKLVVGDKYGEDLLYFDGWKVYDMNFFYFEYNL